MNTIDKNLNSQSPLGKNCLVANRILNTQSSAVRDLLKYSKDPNIISLAGGIPAPDLFDINGLERAMEDEIANHSSATYQYSLSEGEWGLRGQISEMMETRGISARAEDIVITSGSQQGLDLIARVFINPGDLVLVERPAYLAALQIFALAEASLISVGGDVDGMDVDRVEALLQSNKIKAIYLVPNFGNPSTRTLSRERRIRLVNLAKLHNVILIEDDPYGELRIEGDPVSSLYEIAQSIDGAENTVIYASSFSKILAPGLRVGWVISPKIYYGYLAVVKQAIDLHTSSLSQRVVERYLIGSKIQNRLPALQHAYGLRRDSLVSALNKHMQNEISFDIPSGGMFLWAKLNNRVDASALLQYAIREGVVYVPGAAFYATDPEVETLRLSYSMLTPEAADQGVLRLSKALQKFKMNHG